MGNINEIVMVGSDLDLVLAFDECGVKGLRGEVGEREGWSIIPCTTLTMCPLPGIYCQLFLITHGSIQSCLEAGSYRWILIITSDTVWHVQLHT